MFVRYFLKHLEDCEAIANNEPVAIRQDNSQTILSILELIPAGVGTLTSVIKTIKQIYVQTNKDQAIHIVALFEAIPSEDQKEIMLSEGVLRAAFYLERRINDSSKHEVGELAILAANKLLYGLKTSYTEIDSINADVIFKAILKQSIGFWSVLGINNPDITSISGKNYKVISKEEFEDFRLFSNTPSIKKYICAENGLSEDIQILFHNDIIKFYEERSLDLSYVNINYPELYNRESTLKVVNFFRIPESDRRFIERGVLEDIRKGFQLGSESNDVQILYGFVGSGKTQIAKVYGNRYKDNYDGRVRYFDAETEEKLAEGYKLFAEDLELNINGKNITEIIHEVREYLGKTDRALLVYDGAKNKYVLEKYLPRKDGNGKHDVLITTANKEKWSAIGSRAVKLIEIGPLTDNEAILYITENCKRVENEEALKLAKLFDNFILGISHCVAYFNSYESKTVATYIDDFNKAKAERRLLGEYLITEGDDHESNIYSAIKLILDELFPSTIETIKLAGEIITLCSYLDTKDIPYKKLFESIINSNHLDAAKVLSIITDRSLASYDKDNEILSLHGIVQDAVRDHRFSSLNSDLERARELVYSQIKLGSDDLQVLSDNQVMLWHLKSLVGHYKTITQENFIIVARLHTDCANLFFILGMLVTAEYHYQSAKDVIDRPINYISINIKQDGVFVISNMRSFHKEADILLINIFQGLGNIYARQSKYQLALDSYDEALSKNLHSEIKIHKDFSIARIYYSIAGIYCRTGEYDKSIEYLKKSLDKILINDISSFTSEEVIESTLTCEQEEHFKGLLIRQRVEEKSLAVKILDLAGSVYKGRICEDRLVYEDDSFKTLYVSFSRFFRIKVMVNAPKALVLYEQAYSINNVFLKPDHPQLVLNHLNIAGVKMLLRHQDALVIFENILDLYKNNDQHVIKRAMVQKYIGDFSLYNGDYAAAEKKYNEVLKIEKGYPTHTHNSYLGVTYLFIGHTRLLGYSDYSKAIDYYNKALRSENSGYTIKHIAEDCLKITELSLLLIVPFVIKNLLESNMKYFYENIIPARNITFEVSKPALITTHFITSFAGIYLIDTQYVNKYKFGAVLAFSTLPYGMNLYKPEVYCSVLAWSSANSIFTKQDMGMFYVFITFGIEILLHRASSSLLGKIQTPLKVDLAARVSFIALEIYVAQQEKEEVKDSNQWMYDNIPRVIDCFSLLFIANKIKFEKPVFHMQTRTDLVTNMILAQQVIITINLIAVTDHVTKLVLHLYEEQFDNFVTDLFIIIEEIRDGAYDLFSMQQDSTINPEVVGGDITVYEEL